MTTQRSYKWIIVVCGSEKKKLTRLLLDDYENWRSTIFVRISRVRINQRVCNQRLLLAEANFGVFCSRRRELLFGDLRHVFANFLYKKEVMSFVGEFRNVLLGSVTEKTGRV
jgi:Fe-S cluster biosynthesis and repair protein YggX